MKQRDEQKTNTIPCSDFSLLSSYTPFQVFFSYASFSHSIFYYFTHFPTSVSFLEELQFYFQTHNTTKPCFLWSQWLHLCHCFLMGIALDIIILGPPEEVYTIENFSLPKISLGSQWFHLLLLFSPMICLSFYSLLLVNSTLYFSYIVSSTQF